MIPAIAGPLASPFKNLTREAKFLQAFRFTATLVAILSVLIALVGPLINVNFYIGKMNCSHLDVSKGLYDSLRSSVSEGSSLALQNEGSGAIFPFDTSLTNSEISILSKYALEQVENAPQYFIGSLWKWCVGNYNLTTQYTNGEARYSKHNEVLKCSYIRSQLSLIDYQATLQQYDLEGVLAYTFKSVDYFDPAYESRTRNTINRLKAVPVCLILNCVITAGLLLFQFILYGNRKKDDTDLSSLPLFLLHIVTIISAIAFILIAVSIGTMTEAILLTKREVSKNFGSYGINLEFGQSWFALVWLGFLASALLMLSWAVPIWCANPPEDDEYDESYIYSRPGDFNKRHTSSHHKDLKLGSVPQSARDLLLYASDDELEADDALGVSPFEITDELGPLPKELDRTGSAKSASLDKKLLFDYTDKEESKLRKLGESLSRNTSVRHLNAISRKASNKSELGTIRGEVMSKEAAKNFIYEHGAYSPAPHQHYRMETFDGFNKRGDITELEEVKPSSPDNGNLRNRERQFKHNTNNNPFVNGDQRLSPPNTQKQNIHTPDLNRDSILNDDEVNYLESNHYINRI